MHLHILGICGTFMGGIALLARQQGHHVTGSDENIYPPMSQQLREQGIELFEGYDSKPLQSKPDQIIVGNAMKRGMPVIEYLLNEGLSYTSGPSWLAENILPNRWVIAVSGTHGKTTTASLLTWILESAGTNPSFLIGGIPENFGISARLTDSPFFVIEADEYDSAFFDKRSKFIHYRPRTLIINNLEFDHADIFENLADIQKQFHHLIRTVPANGLIIAPSDDSAISQVIAKGCWTPVTHFSLQPVQNLARLREKASIFCDPLLTYSHVCCATVLENQRFFAQPSEILNKLLQQNDDWNAQTITPDGSHFEIYKNSQKQGEIAWNLIGQHNIHNALAALLAAQHAGIAIPDAVKAFATFKNVKRRLEVRGQINGITVYDDFAHHPTAIAATLNGLRHKIGNQRIIAVMELGSYTMRTGVHKHQLAPSLCEADQVIFLNPQENWGIDEVMKNCSQSAQLFNHVDDIISHVVQIAKRDDHILIMSNSGFGNIHQKLLEAIRNMHEIT